MKKLIILVVVMMVAPLYAADVTITADVSVPGQATISYVTTELAGPIGIALDVAADSAIATCDSQDSFFDVLMEVAYEAETAAQGSYTYGDTGLITAVIADHGTLALPATDFCISIAGLGGTVAPANASPTGGVIAVLTTDGTVDVAVDLSENLVRGGIVDKNGAMTVILPGTFTIAADVVVEPGCQPLGDADGNEVVNFQDFGILKDSYGKSLGDANYDARADFDGNDQVNFQDFGILKDGYGKTCAELE